MLFQLRHGFLVLRAIAAVRCGGASRVRARREEDTEKGYEQGKSEAEKRGVAKSEMAQAEGEGAPAQHHGTTLKV